MDAKVRMALVSGINAADNKAKQDLGRRFAERLGLTAGPRGPDDGIDGETVHQGRKVHFQCKLKRGLLDKDEARIYYSDIRYHQAAISIMLAGTGYKATFRERLFGHPDIANVAVHLITLDDLFDETLAFSAAARDLPPLRDLARVALGFGGR